MRSESLRRVHAKVHRFPRFVDVRLVRSYRTWRHGCHSHRIVLLAIVGRNSIAITLLWLRLGNRHGLRCNFGNLGNLGELGDRIHEVATGIVPRLRGIFGILRSRFGGRLSEIVPDLILLVKVDLDLILVVHLMKLELCPSITASERIVLARFIIFGTFGVQQILCLPCSRHGNGIRRSLW